MEFGFRIRELRKEKGISLRDFAKAIGISAPYLSNIERGMVPPPSADVVKLIAEELEIDSDDLLQNANRFDIEELDDLRRSAFKLEKAEKFIKFLNSALGLDEHDEIGGFGGTIEIVIGEMMLNPDFRTQNNFKTTKFLLDLVSKQNDERGRQEIELRRKLGNIVWSLFHDVASPYPVENPEAELTSDEKIMAILNEYPPDLLEEVVKRDNLRAIVQQLSEKKSEEADEENS